MSGRWKHDDRVRNLQIALEVVSKTQAADWSQPWSFVPSRVQSEDAAVDHTGTVVGHTSLDLNAGDPARSVVQGLQLDM